jgi:hypothetical protein
MSDEMPDEIRTRAADLVTKAAEGVDGDFPKAELGFLADALEQDLGAACDKASLDEQRLAKVETQTRVLSEAVVAITEVAATVGPAVLAVKAEM